LMQETRQGVIGGEGIREGGQASLMLVLGG
jgi:hypothetical protein